MASPIGVAVLEGRLPQVFQCWYARFSLPEPSAALRYPAGCSAFDAGAYYTILLQGLAGQPSLLPG